MDCVRDSLTARHSSRSLRSTVCSWARNVFFTYCCVIVEPPCSSPPRAMPTTARASPRTEKPGSLRKVAFSAAIAAFCSATGTCARGTLCRFTAPTLTICEPSAQ